jgi:hypothetical protein
MIVGPVAQAAGFVFADASVSSLAGDDGYRRRYSWARSAERRSRPMTRANNKNR